MKKKLVIRGASAVSMLTLLAACGSSTSSNAVTTTIESTVDIVGFNDDDVMFAQMMVPHHEQAIEMADIALDPSVEASKAITHS